MKNSIYNILENKEIQFQWKEICRLHNITKKYLLLAEEVCEEGVVFLQPLKEHRDAYDHVIRTFSLEIKEIPEDFNAYGYVKGNLQKAYGHEYRAFFDMADWLTYNLRKIIRLRIERMDGSQREAYSQALKVNGLKNIDHIINLLNEYPYKVAEKRYNKDIISENKSNDIEEYIKIIDLLYNVYKITPI